MPSQTRPTEVPPAASGARPWRADLRRSCACFAEFRYEQPDPARFYTALAAGLGRPARAATPTSTAPCCSTSGGGPGYFRDAFRGGRRDLPRPRRRRRRALRRSATSRAGTVIGSGMQLPFADGAVDVCYSSNVLEHVPDPWRMADEMVRVTRPGGIAFLSYTVWFGPWGGHETSPWHFLGGAGPGAATPRRTVTSPRTSTASRCSAVTVGRRAALGAHAAARRGGATSSRATTPGGAAGCSACRCCGRW